MARHYVIALLALGAASVPAQASPVQPSPDSVRERIDLRKLSTCLAERRPDWARKTLALPYLSQAQMRSAMAGVSDSGSCMRGLEIDLRYSGVVGSLAEHYLQSDLKRADARRLAAALSKLEPLNTSEDFALCVVARNPAAARDLALSEPGSQAETEAVGRLESAVGPCTAADEKFTVDLQSLRALTSTALYRGVSTVLASND
ncbi:MAG TPA: hypothetical protein VD846_02135 [Allosphingosinicella sp.]|nr:hypothetical protein [Allosphingosinicella sp.]